MADLHTITDDFTGAAGNIPSPWALFDGTTLPTRNGSGQVVCSGDPIIHNGGSISTVPGTSNPIFLDLGASGLTGVFSTISVGTVHLFLALGTAPANHFFQANISDDGAIAAGSSFEGFSNVGNIGASRYVAFWLDGTDLILGYAPDGVDPTLVGSYTTTSYSRAGTSPFNAYIGIDGDNGAILEGINTSEDAGTGPPSDTAYYYRSLIAA